MLPTSCGSKTTAQKAGMMKNTPGRICTWQLMKINEQGCYGERWDFTGPVERLLKAISSIMAYSWFGLNYVGKKLLLMDGSNDCCLRNVSLSL